MGYALRQTQGQYLYLLFILLLYILSSKHRTLVMWTIFTVCRTQANLFVMMYFGGKEGIYVAYVLSVFKYKIKTQRNHKKVIQR